MEQRTLDARGVRCSTLEYSDELEFPSTLMEQRTLAARGVLLYHCILLLNLHEHVAGGVLLLAAASVADGALPCHWSRRPGQHPQVPSHNFSLAYKMFAHKLPSGA